MKALYVHGESNRSVFLLIPDPNFNTSLLLELAAKARKGSSHHRIKILELEVTVPWPFWDLPSRI
jgi:hypothetical protein